MFAHDDRRRYPQATAADQRCTVPGIQVAERKARHGDVIPPYTSRRRPYPYSDRSGQEQTPLMQPYKGYLVTASAMPVHPFNADWYVGGSVLVPGRASSIVEVTRFQ